VRSAESSTADLHPGEYPARRGRIRDEIDHAKQTVRRHWPVLLLTAYALVGFGRFLPANYVSSDWWPVLATNHLATLDDLPRVFTEPNAVRDPAYVQATALDYRPLGTISYALDYKLWGFSHPWGYQITNLAGHTAVVLSTYVLARELGLPRWASALAGVVFTSHPGIVATEPGIGRRLDVLSAAFGLISLILILRGGSWRLILAGILFCCSILSKETSLAMIPPLAGFLLIRRKPLWRLVALVPPVTLAMALRLSVLGGIGGYGTAAIPSLGRLAAYREAMVRFLADFAAPGPPEGTYAELSAQLSVLTILVIVAAVLCPFRERWIALLGLAWFLMYAELYALLRVYNGGWYLYQPMIGIGLLVGSLATGGVARWPTRRAVPGLSLATVAFVVGVHSSTLLTPYPEWLDIGQQVTAYLAAVDTCTESGDPPLIPKQKGPYSDVLAATGLADYSVRAYIQLRFPDGSRICQ
jgi:hypothetical protein